jgi:hypothetical protein
MLTYRLTGTTEDIGIDHDEPDQSLPESAPPTRATSAQSSRTTVRLEDGAALLSCRRLINEANVPKSVPKGHENDPRGRPLGPFPLVAGTGFEPATSGL